MLDFVSFGHRTHLTGLKLPKRDEEVRLDPSQTHRFAVLRSILQLFVSDYRGNLEKEFVVSED